MTRPRRAAAWTLRAAAFAGAVFLCLSLLEGLCRVLPALWKCAGVVRAAALGHSPVRGDAMLGWTNALDALGPAAAAPRRPGKVRIVCSGDALTLGTGASSGRAWCQQLASLDPDVETVNLGAPLYSLGQSYLRYLRDGAPLDPDIHILAVGSLEAQRLELAGPGLLPRPRVELREGAPAVIRPPGWSWPPVSVLVPAAHILDSRLRLHRVLGKLLPGYHDRERFQSLFLGICEALRTAMQARRGALLVVFLPTVEQRADYWRTPELDALTAELSRRGIASVNLAAEMRLWPLNFQHGMFLPPGAQYTPEAQRILSTIIYRRMRVLDGISRKFSTRRAGR